MLGTAKAGWFIMDTPIKVDDFRGTPMTQETPIFHGIFHGTEAK